MIELGHVATGALVGRRCPDRVSALIAGMASHALLDVAPHGEVGDEAVEVVSSLGAWLALVARFGPRDTGVWGALGAAMPDFEHVLPRAIKPRRALFPTHRYELLHSSDTPLAIPAWVQMVLGGAVVGGLIARRRDR